MAGGAMRIPDRGPATRAARKEGTTRASSRVRPARVRASPTTLRLVLPERTMTWGAQQAEAVAGADRSGAVAAAGEQEEQPRQTRTRAHGVRGW